MVHDLADAQQQQDREPDQHDRPEQVADAAGAEALHGDRAISTTSAIGTTSGAKAGVATFRASTALSTEMAGVSRQSP